MVKIAFLFLTISSISHEQVWYDFFKGHDEQCSIYIHAKEDFDPISTFKKYEMNIKVPTTWANTINAQIAMLKEALKDPSNEKFIFISGDALPLQHFDYVYQQVMQHPLSIFTYSWNNHQDPSSSFYYPQRALTGIPLDRQFKNTQWIILNRKHAQMMVEDQAIVATVTQFPCDNEHYPSTFLAMHNILHEVVNQPTTLTVWHRGYKHPFTFSNMEDFYQAELIVEAINQGLLFARKFDQDFDIHQLQALVTKYGYKTPNSSSHNNLS